MFILSVYARTSDTLQSDHIGWVSIEIGCWLIGSLVWETVFIVAGATADGMVVLYVNGMDSTYHILSVINWSELVTKSFCSNRKKREQRKTTRRRRKRNQIQSPSPINHLKLSESCTISHSLPQNFAHPIRPILTQFKPPTTYTHTQLNKLRAWNHSMMEIRKEKICYRTCCSFCIISRLQVCLLREKKVSIFIVFPVQRWAHRFDHITTILRDNRDRNSIVCGFLKKISHPFIINCIDFLRRSKYRLLDSKIDISNENIEKNSISKSISFNHMRKWRRKTQRLLLYWIFFFILAEWIFQR